MSVVEYIHTELERTFAGRHVVCAGGVLAGMGGVVHELRDVGVERMLLIATGTGTGPVPTGDDVDIIVHELPSAPSATASFRLEEAMFADPPAELVDAVRLFVGAHEPIVLGQQFAAVQRFGPYRIFGARRPEWVALEDKTRVDELFEYAGVPHPPTEVVPVAELHRLSDAVVSGDAREGFNGGADFVRWIRDDASRAAAIEFFSAHCDRVRVSPFVDGVPCSIHGFVTEHGVVALRPVELMTLRADNEKGLRYAGAATYFDPRPEQRDEMRAATGRLGAYLRTLVAYRGPFTIDGICSADGWVATECNPRAGAALGYVGMVAPETLPSLTGRATVAGGLGALDTNEIEDLYVTRADAQRWGGAWTPTTVITPETSTPVVDDGTGRYRVVRADETADATIHTGPSPVGSFVRFEPVAARTPIGPSLAPRAAAAFAFADATFSTGIGPLWPAPDVAHAR